MFLPLPSPPLQGGGNFDTRTRICINNATRLPLAPSRCLPSTLWGAQTPALAAIFPHLDRAHADEVVLATGGGEARRGAGQPSTRAAGRGQGRRHRAGCRTRYSPAGMRRNSRCRCGRRFGHAEQHEHERSARRTAPRNLLGGVRGEKRLVHPNDEVNLGQSSNDILPHRDACRCGNCRRTPAAASLRTLRATLEQKAKAFDASSRSVAPTCRTRRR